MRACVICSSVSSWRLWRPAAGYGLRVPRTLISNSAAAARRFADQSATGAVIKMLGAGTIHEDHSRKISFTHRLTGGDLDDLAGFDVTCHQMQHIDRTTGRHAGVRGA